MKNKFVWALAVGFLATSAPAEVLKVGNARTEVAIAGNGAGTVVLESGLGDTMDPWKPLLPVINQFAHSFAYNRLGYGRSGPAMKDPTPERVAQHLHALLSASGLPKPWTMVGHSLGGAYALTFARLYPADVGAIVLVDPTPPGQSDFTREHFPADYKMVRTITGIMGGNAKEEFRAFDGSKEAFDALGPFPAVPIYLLESTKADPSMKPELHAWIVERHRDLAQLSPCPVSRAVADAGHYIQRDQPKAVLAAIYEAANRPHC